ncbi:helix-turn-helix transcriptional regulator [Lentzea sp. NPDC042327]|uniref:helix-turn-helix domain-containing protein n=1 Tax=Lentzea sp. NPDC042327 TaxID=3154801 RepID=UPI00340A5349
MPKDFRATALERAIGRRLAAWRDARQLSLTEAGRLVGFSSAKLSMMENAIQPSAVLDIMALGYVYGVPALEWQTVVKQAQHANLVRAVTDDVVLFDPVEDLPALVGEATRLGVFAPDAVPSLLQIPDYASIVVDAGDPVRGARHAVIRHAWAQRLRDSDPIVVRAVFPEAVLRMTVGGRRVMKAQLLHLVGLSELETVSIKVVPRGAGACPVTGGSFTLLSFSHRQHNDVAYFESFIKGEYVEDVGLTEKCVRHFEALSTLALNEGESVELIAEATAELSS